MCHPPNRTQHIHYVLVLLVSLSLESGPVGLQHRSNPAGPGPASHRGGRDSGGLCYLLSACATCHHIRHHLGQLRCQARGWPTAGHAGLPPFGVADCPRWLRRACWQFQALAGPLPPRPPLGLPQPEGCGGRFPVSASPCRLGSSDITLIDDAADFPGRRRCRAAPTLIDATDPLPAAFSGRRAGLALSLYASASPSHATAHCGGDGRRCGRTAVAFWRPAQQIHLFSIIRLPAQAPTTSF